MKASEIDQGIKIAFINVDVNKDGAILPRIKS